jgi:hypothetical protein
MAPTVQQRELIPQGAHDVIAVVGIELEVETRSMQNSGTPVSHS